MTTDEQNQNQDDALGEGGKRALDAERKARRDAEKALREAREQITSYERRDVLREVASAKGIPDALAARLVGTTREELEADADSLLETIKPAEQADTTKVPGLPTERLRGGGDPTVNVDEPAATMAERIVNS